MELSEDITNLIGNDNTHQLSGMFRDWYLQYASYVILERSVPNIDDGLKPVQRRILHSMQTLDDGRYNKVANIVGNTMQYHPHGDASIGDALVQLGQKELLIDTQGNWGNILTGDSAAAPRYIEGRLSEFALETVFNPKITDWGVSYDGRKREPLTLPVKFPLLLAQGVEGIAVALTSKILPHNFNELLDAAVAYLRGEEFTLYPDFQTGGYVDVSKYNDGRRGGSVKVRARIEKIDSKTLAITELPFSKNTSTLISSILGAMEKGKIKIKRVDNNTSATAEILIHLAPGTSSDKAIDALYAFTDCEVSISPNGCVIDNKMPKFLSVTELLQHSVDRTRHLLASEIEIELAELREKLHFASLEKIFISERMYKDRQYEEGASPEEIFKHLRSRFEPWAENLVRPITDEDLQRLEELPMKRIHKYNADKAEEDMARIRKKIEELEYDLAHMVDTTIRWYTHLKEKYGAHFPRRTVIRGFDSIEAAKVAEANKHLYLDKKGGFVGTGLKDAEEQFLCSDLDDILIVYNDGKYKITRVQEKFYAGKNIRYVGLFKRGDKRTVYNVIYRNGKEGYYYKKRFMITSLTRDREYDITKGAPGSKLMYFSANPNGETDVVKAVIDDRIPVVGRRPRQKDVVVDFADLDIKGKEALGNIVTKNRVSEVRFMHKGASTLGGREVWFDRDVLRLNYDGRGESIGPYRDFWKIYGIAAPACGLVCNEASALEPMGEIRIPEMR
jgi:topoisomerase-4 subunit A